MVNENKIFEGIDPENAILQLIGVAAIDGDAVTRQVALKILGSYHGMIPFIYLRDVLLNDDQEKIRAEAAASLGEEGDPIALRVLEKVIADPNETSKLVKQNAKTAIKGLLGINN